MPFDFSRIKAPHKAVGPIDPIEIFQKNKSKITDADINDLWLGQGDALREWHEHRPESDVAIVLNTGAGKTLIGLLVAQSLLHETQGKVVYACASIQLIEQTKAKAEGYGLQATTYYGQQFSDDGYHKHETICLTTYQALFNGRSIFKHEDIAAIIFDDAHAAEAMIKNHFAIHVDRGNSENLFTELMGLFSSYYHKVGKSGSFSELLAGETTKVHLIPPFEVIKNIAEIRRLLVDNGIPKQKRTLFAWEYLKDHLDLCAFIVSNNGLQIIPPMTPVSHLPYFQKPVRRVYLSATMLGEDAFIRTFGRRLDYTVQPQTSAGQCERLIIFPEQVYAVDDDCAVTKAFIDERKALILVPNYSLSEKWIDIAYRPSKDNIDSIVEDVETFKNSDAADKLVLIARYDGIDLPGDSCRHLVIDGLPTGTGLLDRYMWESLRLSNTLRSIIACRIVQSLGRISRGMNDHGVVIITGKSCVEWLLTPINQAYLPGFIQKQIKLGLEISSHCESINDIPAAADSCLNRDTNWVSAYEQFMESCDVENPEANHQILVELATAESHFIKHYWDRDFDRATQALNKLLDTAFDHSAGLGAWYALWLGYCCERSDDYDTATMLYKRAHGAMKTIPRHLDNNIDLSANKIPAQVANIASQFTVHKSTSVIASPQNLIANLQALDGNASSAEVEEAIRYLGQYLGLDATRPDKEHGTGPDDLWLADGMALVIEAKTNKQAQYKKSDLGQLSDHQQWVHNHYGDLEQIPVFVGPLYAASSSANPAEDILVIELAELRNLADRLIAAYQDIEQRALPVNLPQEVESVLNERSLCWPDVFNTLNKYRLIDLE